MEPEVENTFLEELAELIDHTLALCPPYNRAAIVLNQLEGRSVGEVGRSYPEIFDEKILPTIIDLFGAQFGGEITYSNNSVGRTMLEFLKAFQDALDNDEIRETIGKNLGRKWPSPYRDYIEQCVKTLEENDPTALKLWQVIAGEGSIYDFDTIIENALEHGVEISKTNLIGHLTSLRQLDVIEWTKDAERVSVKEAYKSHAKELID